MVDIVKCNERKSEDFSKILKQLLTEIEDDLQKNLGITLSFSILLKRIL